MQHTKQVARAAIAVFLAICWIGCTDLKGADDRAGEDAAVVTDGGAGMSGQSGNMSGSGGESGQGGEGGQGGTLAGPVPASATRFSSLGEPRSGMGISLRDDGFELGERRCTASGELCVTGGFEP